MKNASRKRTGPRLQGSPAISSPSRLPFFTPRPSSCSPAQCPRRRVSPAWPRAQRARMSMALAEPDGEGAARCWASAGARAQKQADALWSRSLCPPSSPALPRPPCPSLPLCLPAALLRSPLPARPRRLCCRGRGRERCAGVRGFSRASLQPARRLGARRRAE
jgi:hypothetical protein